MDSLALALTNWREKQNGAKLNQVFFMMIIFLGFLCTCFDQLEREIGIDSLKSDFNHSIKKKANLLACWAHFIHHQRTCAGDHIPITHQCITIKIVKEKKSIILTCWQVKICCFDSLAGVFFFFFLWSSPYAEDHLVLFKMSMISWLWKWSWCHSKTIFNNFLWFDTSSRC